MNNYFYLSLFCVFIIWKELYRTNLKQNLVVLENVLLCEPFGLGWSVQNWDLAFVHLSRNYFLYQVYDAVSWSFTCWLIFLKALLTFHCNYQFHRLFVSFLLFLNIVKFQTSFPVTWISMFIICSAGIGPTALNSLPLVRSACNLLHFTQYYW